MSTPDTRSLQASANASIRAHIPKYVWDGTVAIVVARRPAIYLLGTGSLFQIADRFFVVTAAHVIKEAHLYDRTIGISGDSSFISVSGDWICSVSNSEDDVFDIAVCSLPPDAVQRLSHFRFFRIDDVSFDEYSKTRVFTLFGHPSIWSTPSKKEGDLLQLKRFEYTAIAYQGSVKDLTNYDPRYHLLLDANSEEITWDDGTKAEFTDREGKNRTFPRELQGISGCPVWRTVDLGEARENGSMLVPKLVGVETGIYQPSQVIRVTRWAAVMTLINAAFPELRPAINLIR
jgi:hypothetical protein